MPETTRQVIEDFLQTVEREGPRAAFEQYAVEGYIQHNPWAAQGREGGIAYLEKEAAKGVQGAVKRMIVEGDLGAIHLHLSFADGSPDLAIVDIWRVEEGKLVEHWDITQEIPKTVSVESMF